MLPKWKWVCLVLSEIILLISSLSLDLLPQTASNPGPSGDDALLLMIAAYSRLETSAGSAAVSAPPTAIQRGTILPVSLFSQSRSAQDQINEFRILADLYWTYAENAKDPKARDSFAAQAEEYSKKADALEGDRSRRRGRSPAIARFFHGVGKAINAVVGGIVVGGAKATQFVVEEALPAYVQMMLKTLPDKKINLLWDKLAARLGGGPAGEFLAKKIRKFIDPYFVRLRDSLFRHREAKPTATESGDTTSSDIVNAEGTFTFFAEGWTYTTNEISLHFDPTGGPVTGEAKQVFYNVNMDCTWNSVLIMEITGTYNAETKSFKGGVQVKSTYTCSSACQDCPEDFDYPASWWATLDGNSITGEVDGRGPIELVVK
jgi:hypothetical protein